MINKKIVHGTFKKYELITSHTARRSFATNGYLSSITTYLSYQIAY